MTKAVVVANATVFVTLALFLLGLCANSIHLAFMSKANMEDKPQYVMSSSITELTLAPVVIMLGLIILVIINAVLSSKQKGLRAPPGAKYGWGGLAVCALAFITAMVPAIMVPLMDYMNTTLQEFSEMGTAFQVMVCVRAAVAVLFVVAGIMVLKNQ